MLFVLLAFHIKERVICCQGASWCVWSGFMAVIQNDSTQPTKEKVRPTRASSMTKQPPAWRLVIIIGNRCHRSSRISASGDVQQQFVFLILVHFLPRRITSQPSKKESRPLRR